MKSKLLSLSFILLFALASCDSEDGKVGNQNNIDLNGQSFKITTATLIEIADDTEVYTSMQFVGVNADGSFKDLTLALLRSPNEKIAGTYTFPQQNTRHLDDWLTAYTDYSDPNNPLDYHLLEGSVIVEANGGNNYKVTVDLTMEGQKFFTGFYKGEFQTGAQ